MEPGTNEGYLIVEPEDLSGTYDYIPDIESMSVPSEAEALRSQRELIQTVLNPAVDQRLMSLGYQLDLKELLVNYFEQLGLKDAEKYFTKGSMQQGMMPNETNTGAGPIAKGSSLGSEYDLYGRMAEGNQTPTDQQII